MVKKYKTNEIAQIIGVHPNTVRMYEDIKFISRPNRRENGHREFTELHISQMQFARLALHGELLQNSLRKKAIQIIKLCGECKFKEAICETYQYKTMLEHESKNAKEAIQAVANILGNHTIDYSKTYKRQEMADLLEVTIDTLRNWELNGLMTVARKSNGYRIYNEEDLQRLKIIRILRCANYSLSSILRLMNRLSEDTEAEMEVIINTPAEDEDIISACDRLLTSLERTNQDADEMLLLLSNLTNKPPL